jgi:hypothetical protein
MSRERLPVRRGRPALRRVDPFCWLAVVCVLVIAGLLFVSSVPQLGIVVVAVAVSLVFFDAWVNRPVIPSAQPRRPLRPQPRTDVPHLPHPQVPDRRRAPEPRYQRQGDRYRPDDGRPRRVPAPGYPPPRSHR